MGAGSVEAVGGHQLGVTEDAHTGSDRTLDPDRAVFDDQAARGIGNAHKARSV